MPRLADKSLHWQSAYTLPQGPRSPPRRRHRRAGAWQWHPKDVKEEDLAPQVDGSGQKVPTMMATTDIALREDPEYRKRRLKWRD